MAAFTDQFTRRDPLSFGSSSLLGLAIGTALSGSKLMVGRRGTAELAHIARAIDAAVALEAKRQARKYKALMPRPLVQGVAADFFGLKKMREREGDLAYFRAAGGARALTAAGKPLPGLQPWEPWAVLALWKVFDYLDALENHDAIPVPPFRWVNAKDVATYSRAGDVFKARTEVAANLAAEACSAYERAVAEAELSETRSEAAAAAAIAAAKNAASNLDDALSQRGRDAANALHDQPGGSREKHAKIRAAWATGEFKSRDICAEKVGATLAMSFSAARKALRGTPDPT